MKINDKKLNAMIVVAVISALLLSVIVASYSNYQQKKEIKKLSNVVQILCSRVEIAEDIELPNVHIEAREKIRQIYINCSELLQYE